MSTSTTVTNVEADVKGFFSKVLVRGGAVLKEVGAFFAHLFAVVKGDVVLHVIVPVEKLIGDTKVTTTIQSPTIVPVPPVVPETPVAPAPTTPASA